MRLEHIGIAVRDVTAARSAFAKLLGSEPYKVETVESENVVTHFLWADGVKIELLEATSSDSVIQQFLDKRGEGLHHLAFNVDDIDVATRSLSEAGFVVIGDSPKGGADGNRIFFIHPKDTHGVLIECCEQSESGPSPVALEHRDGIEIARFGSNKNPAVLVVVGPDNNGTLGRYKHIVDRLEPTHNIFRVVRLSDSAPFASGQSPPPSASAMNRVTISDPFDIITIGPGAEELVRRAIDFDKTSAGRWIHIYARDQASDEASDQDSIPEHATDVISSRVEPALIQTLSTGRLRPVSISVLPESAMNPANPTFDALLPLLKSLLRG